MKNSRIAALLVLAFTVASVYSCRSTDLIPSFDPSTGSIIDGDTVLNRIEINVADLLTLDLEEAPQVIVGMEVINYKAPKLAAKSFKELDLTNLKNITDAELESKPFRMVSVGGNLTAGVRDGGYFNEGIATSYPSQIARQLGIDFSQPTFSKENYNGVGRKQLSTLNPTGGPVPKFIMASNNTALSKGLEMEKVTRRIDNFAIPSSSRNSLVPYQAADGNGIAQAFFDRLKTTESLSVFELLSKDKFDFFLFEFASNDVINYILDENKGFTGWPDFRYIEKEIEEHDQHLTIPREIFFLDKLYKSGAKNGVILNIPNMLELPYFKYFTKDDVMAVGQKYQKTIYFDEGSILTNYESEFVLPTSEVDSLLGDNVNVALKKGLSNRTSLSDRSVKRQAKQFSDDAERIFNKEVEMLGAKYGYAVADINQLYKKILSGRYISDDGYSISVYGKENSFFSSDGLFPSALGQTIVANEVIRTINAAYKMEIPLISLGHHFE